MNEEQEETMALLKLLAMGNNEIEEGRFRSADVYSRNWTNRDDD